MSVHTTLPAPHTARAVSHRPTRAFPGSTGRHESPCYLAPQATKSGAPRTQNRERLRPRARRLSCQATCILEQVHQRVLDLVAALAVAVVGLVLAQYHPKTRNFGIPRPGVQNPTNYRLRQLGCFDHHSLHVVYSAGYVQLHYRCQLYHAVPSLLLRGLPSPTAPRSWVLALSRPPAIRQLHQYWSESCEEAAAE
eukprot:COSAG02_NODE_857_length_16462_cov_4.801381_4_plen_195_part_00